MEDDPPLELPLPPPVPRVRDLPFTFDGSGVWRDFVLRAMDYFSTHEIPPSKHVGLVSSALQGKAEAYFRQWRLDRPCMDIPWDEFTVRMAAGPFRASTSQSHIRSTLLKLAYRKGDIQAYRAKFNEVIQPALGGLESMDAYTQCWFWVRSLPAEIAPKCFLSTANQEWEDLSALQQYSCTLVASHLEAGLTFSASTHPAATSSAKDARQGSSGKKYSRQQTASTSQPSAAGQTRGTAPAANTAGTSRLPPGPCPICGLIHWRSDCPKLNTGMFLSACQHLAPFHQDLTSAFLPHRQQEAEEVSPITNSLDTADDALQAQPTAAAPNASSHCNISLATGSQPSVLEVSCPVLSSSYPVTLGFEQGVSSSMLSEKRQKHLGPFPTVCSHSHLHLYSNTITAQPQTADFISGSDKLSSEFAGAGTTTTEQPLIAGFPDQPMVATSISLSSVPSTGTVDDSNEPVRTSSHSSVPYALHKGEAYCLNSTSLSHLMDTLSVQCTIQAYCFRKSELTLAHTVLPVLDSAFTDSDLADHIPFMHPPPELIDSYLSHYADQKAKYPHLGGILVLPASVTIHTHPEMYLFKKGHIFRRNEWCLASLEYSNRCRTPTDLVVYYDVPGNRKGTTVATLLSDHLYFNLPCTLAGASGGTVAISSSTLFDTGCSTLALLSHRAAKRLNLNLTPHDSALHLASGEVAQVIGQTSLSLNVQSHTFRVRALVIDMTDDFDLILGQQWLNKHDAIVDFPSKIITLRKGNSVIKLGSPHPKVPKRKAHTASTKPLSAAAVARHIRKGHRVFQVTITHRDITDADQPPTQEQSPDPDADLDIRVQRLRTEFSDIFVQDLPPNQQGPPAPEEVIPLEPGATPVYTPPYRASPRETAEMQQQVQEGLETGRIRVSSSPYGSSVLFVSKPDGSLRMCIDYRRLNKQTVKNRHPLPRIDDLLDQFGGAQYFSVIDLKAGYAQIRLPESDIPKTAFNTPFGHFEYTIVPFGLSNAPSVFTKVMQNVLRPVLGRCACVYLDDCLCYSPSAEQHERDLAEILTLLRSHNLYANAKKCQLFLREVKYLGHILSGHGIQVDSAKTAVVSDWPEPTNLKDLQRFLGLANYFRRFVPKYSEVARPLTRLTGKDAFHTPFTVEESHSFKELKKALVSPPTLAIPDFTKPFEVYVDASDIACGGILLQNKQPVAYHSKTFTPAERNYPVHDRECLGIVSAYREWRCYLEGSQSTCYTDHAPLTQLQSQPHISRRQARWLEFLASFRPNVVYVQGEHNPADVLSRPPRVPPVALPDWVGECGQPLNLSSSRQLGESDVLQASLYAYQGNPSGQNTVGGLGILAMAVGAATVPTDMSVTPTSPLSTATKGLSVAANVTPPELLASHLIFQPAFGPDAADWWKLAYQQDPWFTDTHNIKKHQIQIMDSGLHMIKHRLVVPKLMQKQVLQQCHDALSSAHFGVTKTLKQIEQRFWWITWRKDTQAYIANCLLCARNKPLQRKPFGELQPLQTPKGPWQSISMDFITNLPLTSQGNDCILTLVDRFTKMCHFVPTTTACTSTQAAQLCVQHILRLHGVPTSFVVDRDPVWRSNFWHTWCSLLGIQLNMSSAYHPQSDGQTERMNRILEEVLRHYINPSHTNWETLLPWAEFAINSAYQESIKTTPFKLNYGWQPSSPLDVALQPLTKDALAQHPEATFTVESWQTALTTATRILQAAKDRQKHFADSKRTPLTYAEGDYCLLSSKHLTIVTTGVPKLLPRYLGPFKVHKMVGSAAVKLELPSHWKVHNVFHVSLTKPWKGSPPTNPEPVEVEGYPEYTVETILSHDLRSKRKGRQVIYYLVKWEGFGSEHNSWEPEGNLTSDGKFENTAIPEYWKRISIPDAPTQQARRLRAGKIHIKAKLRSLPKRARTAQ